MWTIFLWLIGIAFAGSLIAVIRNAVIAARQSRRHRKVIAPFIDARDRELAVSAQRRAAQRQERLASNRG